MNNIFIHGPQFVWCVINSRNESQHWRDCPQKSKAEFVGVDNPGGDCGQVEVSGLDANGFESKLCLHAPCLLGNSIKYADKYDKAKDILSSNH